ncbi:four-carbon acid sugar kinase family protein [Microbispora sp. NEAU-D428]|uniref:3-oxo-tetronate kinase n=1 Tax=Microbispora sitophila TaxID=2771537 RepID=UPI001866493D|nr:3-oxo-tetronate kinase [Microbispora sitophila]MBE3015524.1 four-carbon acid sugar kinase family protein [Microbispora sitophila]
MIGVIADDYTGATDVAVAFRGANLRTAILFRSPDSGSPDGVAALAGCDVVVVALKTRTIAPAEAVTRSLEALDRLRRWGATQIFFKYCSTFDSRPDGNIGPVADALFDALGAPRAVFVPASPRHLRTQYMGHLFVDQVLLSESSMREHPLTPMTDAFLPRVLAAQTRRRVGLVPRRDVEEGVAATADALARAHEAGNSYILVDAVTERDVLTIGAACADDVLVTGAAGLAAGLGAAHARRLGREPDQRPATHLPVAGPAAVLAGSCSARTLEQIGHMTGRGHPAFRLDATAEPNPSALAARALAWYDDVRPDVAPLFHSSQPPDELRRTQSELGRERASAILEEALGLVARGLRERSVRRFVVAGGESSGAVVNALRITGGMVGDEEAPGVPWIVTGGEQPIQLLLKSGNFGDVQLLARAVTGTAGKA